ncbi:MAG: cell envelope integrity protein CreD [Woeseiaceae bacterium]
MQSFISRLPQSASIKVFAIGFLTLVLLIPLSMIESVIYEREQMGEVARQDIQRTWGNPQYVAGPVLVVPYDSVHLNGRGEEFTNRHHLYVLPQKLDIDGNIEPEVRYRGMHNVPVYSAQLQISGSFGDTWLEDSNLSARKIDWKGVFIALGVSDARAITEIPSVRLTNDTVRFIPGGNQVSGFPPQVMAPIGRSVNAEKIRLTMDFEIDLKINGSESLQFLPAGDTTTVALRSSWSSPSFSGSYLPEGREISDAGFSANWRVSSIGRALPSRWTDASGVGGAAHESGFGVDLYMPISVYRLTERATKYGVLFIGLTFVAYFLFEVVAGLRLHPLQYLLVGFANSLFYLLLLSLAEHIGFGFAYILSCIGSCALIIGYSWSVLGDKRRAAIMAGILLLLYSFLYMTLNAESYAMLAGSIGLWVCLGATMYLTRGIDWYGRRDEDVSS